MNHFEFIDGQLHGEQVPIAEIAEKIGTPFYCYSSATLTRHYEVFAGAFSDIPSMVCYALKANSNQAVIATLAKLGCGADVVSSGELRRALKAGVPPKKIMFSGVGKTRSELVEAIGARIFCFNVESEPELRLLSQSADELNELVPVSIRINPHVDSLTHAKISTGKAGDKFGVDWDRAQQIYALAAELPGIRVCGIDMHIGSQIVELGPFERAFSRLEGLVAQLREQGHQIDHVDLGGGLGIPYKNDNEIPPRPEEYAEIVKRYVKSLNCQVIFEPGRLIAGNAGILVGSIIYRKETDNKTFLISDVAMNDLIRPTLYEAWHEIFPVDQAVMELPPVHGDMVGPVCETGDYIARDRQLPGLVRGDLYAIGSAGAYGAVQSGTYNTRALIPEVMVNGKSWHVIRPRVEVDEIINLDSLPHWLSK